MDVDKKPPCSIKEVKPGSSVYVMDDIISHELCDTLKIVMDKTKRSNRDEYTKTNNVLCEYIPIIAIENQKFAKILDDKIYQCISDAGSQLMSICKEIHHIGSDDGYILRKIRGATRLHSDSVFTDAIENLPKDSPKRIVRKISVIIALNGDYEGGEFYFPNQGIDKIKLKKGQAILFPPYWTHPHGVNKPENNTFRYTINTWLNE